MFQHKGTFLEEQFAWYVYKAPPLTDYKNFFIVQQYSSYIVIFLKFPHPIKWTETKEISQFMVLCPFPLNWSTMRKKFDDSQVRAVRVLHWLSHAFL